MEWTREGEGLFKKLLTRYEKDSVGKGFNPLRELTRVSEAILSPWGIVAPEGGFLVVVRGKWNPARPWNEAALAAGPDTPGSYNALKVGGLYPAGEDKLLDHETILVNFGPGSVTPSAVVGEWGAQYHMEPQHARAVFSVAEKYPHLDRALGTPGRFVLSTLEKCDFRGVLQSPYVGWYESRREASLDPLAYGWVDDCWIAFSRVAP